MLRFRGFSSSVGALACVVIAACGGGAGAADSRGPELADGGASAENDGGASAMTPLGDGGAASSEASAVYPPADIEVTTSAAGMVVPADFLGLSVEWSHLLDYVGDGAGGLRSETVQLLKNFATEDHSLVVRVGGDSEDQAWWNPTAAPRPGGVTVDLNATHVSMLAALHAAANTRFVLGLDLLLGDGANAGALANAVLAALPPSAVIAFELGNEPDLFVVNGKRNLLYGYPSFKNEMDALRDAVVTHVTPAPSFAGPALGTDAWLANLGGFFTAEQTRLSLITTHVYPFTTPCLNLPPPAPADLLSAKATADIATKYGPYAKAAHASGFAYRMAEMNSVSCGGADGVSNAYASALWGAHLAFALAAAGLDGVNFHTPGTYYAAFAYDAGGALSVKPLYYGLRFFSMATANGAKLLPLTIAAPVTAAHVQAWATRDAQGVVRVALLNESSSPATLRIRAGGKTSGSGSLTRLEGGSLAAKTGVTLGRQTYDGSADGKPLGALVMEPAKHDGDAYVVTIPGLQGVLLDVP